MPLYLLIPRHIEAEEWSGSKFHGPIQIEAPNASGARDIATSAFRKPTQLQAGFVTIFLPWMSPRLCHVEVLGKPDPRYLVIARNNPARLDAGRTDPAQ